MTMFSVNLMAATAVELQAVQAAEARAEAADEARVEAELEAQELRAKLVARQAEVDALTARNLSLESRNASLEAENGELARMLSTSHRLERAHRLAYRALQTESRMLAATVNELLDHPLVQNVWPTLDRMARTLAANTYEALERPEDAVSVIGTGTVRRTA